MGTKWHSTKFPGVRFREHRTRKHGLQKDKYFAIRYQKDGERKEEGLGWASGGWNPQKAFVILSDLKNGHAVGEGPTRLSEKRELDQQQKEIEQAKNKRKQADAVTFGDFFVDPYFPQSKANKSWRSWSREEHLFRIWISPVIGKKPLKGISPLDLERIKKNMADAGRAPRTIHYCLAVIRQVFNLAKVLDLYQGDHPVAKIKKPKVDNRRMRFLNHDEADLLLDNLKIRSQQLYEMALLSLHCGLRAGEIFNLTWADVDMERGILMLRDPKGGKNGSKNRAAFMTEDVRKMIASKNPGSNGDLVYPGRNGKQIIEISNAFGRALEAIGLNAGVEDQRYKACFHTLRHTFASWHVEGGTDLYTLKELMGHSTLAMTERYSHLGMGALYNATKNLEKNLLELKSKNVRNFPGQEKGGS